MKAGEDGGRKKQNFWFGSILARTSGRNKSGVFQEMKGDQIWNKLMGKGEDL